MSNITKITVGSTTYDIKDANAQETLVSGTNIKTINSSSILGSGDISVGSIGVDTTNVIASGTQLSSWTAAQDCWLVVQGSTNYLNNITVGGVIIASGQKSQGYICVLIKEGQVVSTSLSNGAYVIYGLKY